MTSDVAHVLLRAASRLSRRLLEMCILRPATRRLWQNLKMKKSPLQLDPRKLLKLRIPKNHIRCGARTRACRVETLRDA
jgi:hypothetical protein